MLQGLISETFTIASGLGVMPAMPILAVKYPRSAALVVPEAPMHVLQQFYISNLAESDLDPLVAVTARERAPAAIEVRLAVTSAERRRHCEWNAARLCCMILIEAQAAALSARAVSIVVDVRFLPQSKSLCNCASPARARVSPVSESDGDVRLPSCRHADHIGLNILSSQAMWSSSKAVKPVVAVARTNTTLEVLARVCAWPHAATMGATGLLHIIVKHNLDLNLYRSNLVQVRALSCRLLTFWSCSSARVHRSSDGLQFVLRTANAASQRRAYPSDISTSGYRVRLHRLQCLAHVRNAQGCVPLQAIIMHKWQSHARRHLIFDIALYALLMALFISDLSIIGLTMGRSFLSAEALASFGGDVPTAQSVLDASPYGLASTVQELCIAWICLRNLWCALLAWCCYIRIVLGFSSILVRMCSAPGSGLYPMACTRLRVI